MYFGKLLTAFSSPCFPAFFVVHLYELLNRNVQPTVGVLSSHSFWLLLLIELNKCVLAYLRKVCWKWLTIIALLLGESLTCCWKLWFLDAFLVLPARFGEIFIGTSELYLKLKSTYIWGKFLPKLVNTLISFLFKGASFTYRLLLMKNIALR